MRYAPSVRRRIPFFIAIVVFFVALWTVPSSWCRRGAGDWYAGDREIQDSLAQTVADQVQRGLSTDNYHTGSKLFNGEWLFGTHLMAGIGFCQIVQQHPEDLEKWRPQIEICIRGLLSPEVRRFDTVIWNQDAIETLADGDGHAAYLGYLNFLLSLYRQIDSGNSFAALNDQITEELIRRASKSANGLIATYPDEWYPVDNAPGLASVAMHGKATGKDHGAFLNMLKAAYREKYIDRSTGLLIQAAGWKGQAQDAPRGSGSALAVFFLSRGFPELAGEMFGAIERNLVTGLFNFGAIREYPRGVFGREDIDSGPIIFGFGFSATGFSIGGARAYGAKDLYSRLYASAVLAGAPIRSKGNVDFLTAGPLGNAIMLAMLTTPRVQP